MNPNQILAHLRREPFRPIRVYVSDGSFYDIRHPENALVTRTEVAVATGDGDGELPERMVYCDPLHITRIEPIEQSQPRRKPGRRKR